VPPWPAPLDDLEGVAPSRRQPSAAHPALAGNAAREWTEAGHLLQIDAFELGHWAHGDRSESHRIRHAGKVRSSA
jgi:hypothetical protein